MEGFDPKTSFGPRVAEVYDDQPRDDDVARYDLVTQLP